jgi:cobalamin biosynthetic protein CobC
VRLGFVAAEAALLARLADYLGPWAVSGPAQQIGCAALADRQWQADMRAQLAQSGARLQRMLAAHGVQSSGTALFQWWAEPQPEHFHEHMATHGIWVRLFANAARGIRLGLPQHERDWQRLSEALAAWYNREQAA